MRNVKIQENISKQNKLIFPPEYWTSYFSSLELCSAMPTTRLRFSMSKDYFSLLAPEDHRKTCKNRIAGDLSPNSQRNKYSQELTTEYSRPAAYLVTASFPKFLHLFTPPGNEGACDECTGYKVEKGRLPHLHQRQNDESQHHANSIGYKKTFIHTQSSTGEFLD